MLGEIGNLVAALVTVAAAIWAAVAAIRTSRLADKAAGVSGEVLHKVNSYQDSLLKEIEDLKNMNKTLVDSLEPKK